ncbi:MAG: hypothetical protein JO107_09460 [Hyphomicrobiales bacterium]|nr:hypothetical protein [Hyphomicrobiales bacterium]MBV8663315.1 hypothetical protein [Hyphomicrobiales bacterium]
MSLPANIRVNVRAPFPAQVAGAGFITVSKKNGVWTIAPNFAQINSLGGLKPTQIFVVYDTVTGLFTSVSVASLNQFGAGVYRTVTTTGNVNAAVTDGIILMQKSSSGPTSISLPQSSLRGGLPLTVKDLTGDANTNNITFVPAIGETIDGFSAAAAAANGVALIDTNYGKKTLFPLTSGGWFI